MDKRELSQKAEELIFLAQGGDTEAFGKVYDMFVDQIYRYVLMKVGNKMDAQDITADTFKRAWINVHRYKRNNFRAYLYTIARNTTIDFFRKASRKTRTSTFKVFIDEKHDVEKSVLRREEARQLYEALHQLPENYNEVILLRFIEGLSVKETARVLGKSSISVRVMQHRAMVRLRGLLQRDHVTRG